MTTQQATAGHNKPTFEDYAQKAEQFGADAGAGRDGHVKFFINVIEGAYHGILDLTEKKHSGKYTDAEVLTKRFFDARSKATVFDAKANNVAKHQSQTKLHIKFGGMPVLGSGEPLATVNKLLTHRKKLRQAPSSSGKLDDAANTLHRFARETIKRGVLPDEAEFDEFCARPKARDKTIVDLAEKARRDVMKLYVKTNDDEFKAAAADLTKWLREFASKKKAGDVDFAA